MPSPSPDTCVHIDGSRGEGGGQIVRTALTLALVTGRSVNITNIRAHRPKPGLMPQHLAVVRAAEAIGAARVSDISRGAMNLRFEPTAVIPGEYSFDVGNAGSATLAIQAVLLPLLTADGPSELVVRGGTHTPGAPPFEFLEHVYLPALRTMGAQVTASLKRHGFAPGGGGEVRVEIDPVPHLSPRDWLQRGALRAITCQALVANLSPRIGHREVQIVTNALRGVGVSPQGESAVVEVEGQGPGNAVVITVKSEEITEVFTGFGQKSLRAEAIARGAADRAEDYIARGAPVGSHLADQLLLPMALAGGGTIRTASPTPHTHTNMDLLRAFLDVSFEEETDDGESWFIRVQRCSSPST